MTNSGVGRNVGAEEQIQPGEFFVPHRGHFNGRAVLHECQNGMNAVAGKVDVRNRFAAIEQDLLE